MLRLITPIRVVVVAIGLTVHSAPPALHASLQAPRVHRLVLRDTPFRSAELVPIYAEYRVGQSIPAELMGIVIPTKVVGKQLQVDSDADGKIDRRLARAEIIEVGSKSNRRRVLVYPKQSQWYACAGTSFSGRIGRVTIQFLDSNLDGKLTAGKDLVRIGQGGFGLHEKGRLLWTGSRIISYEVVEDSDDLAIEWKVQSEYHLKDALLQKSFDLINKYRNSAGLPAVLPDTKTSEACAKHIAYLNRHFKVRKSTTITAEEMKAGPHSEDPKKEGYSKEGDLAARSSSIGQSGNPIHDLSPGIWATALHRQMIVSPLSSRAGIAYGGDFSLIWIRDWHPYADIPPSFVPAPGQRKVPTTARYEIPEPEEYFGFYSTARGFPISVTFLRDWKSPVIRLFEDKRGKEVRGYFFSPEQPIHSARPKNMGALIFMASKPLTPKTRYRATLSGTFKGQPRSFHWSFRTGS